MSADGQPRQRGGRSQRLSQIEREEDAVTTHKEGAASFSGACG